MQTLSLNYEAWQWMVITILFIPETISDLRYKKVHPAFIISLSLASEIMYWFSLSKGLVDLIVNLIPGTVLLLLSLCSGSGIGPGDGLIVIFIGAICGMERTILILILSFIVCAVFSVFLLLLKKVTTKTRLPFVPFMFLSTLLLGVI